MKESFHVLTHVPLAGGATLARPPATTGVTRDSPALDVMTDFRQVRAVTITPETSIETALAVMRHAGVRLLMVTDRDDGILGLVTANDIQGEKPVRLTRETGLSHASITVEMIMTPQAAVTALPLEDVQRWRVGHVVATLHQLERQHTLVVETTPAGRQCVCGLFSTTQIGRQLGEDLTLVQASAHSIVELQHEMG